MASFGEDSGYMVEFIFGEDSGYTVELFGEDSG